MKKKKTLPIVDIIAPASAVSKKECQLAITKLKSMGFQPRIKNIKPASLPFFAQEEKQCVKHLIQALMSADSKIIWALRGGYGTQRLLPQLDKIKNNKFHKKLFIGHSDTTTLHDWIHQNLSWPTLHFPVLKELPHLPLSSFKQIHHYLNQKPSSLLFKNLKVLNPNNKFKKIISSKISGGNMTAIQSLLATPWQISRKNQILFLEDNANESPYRVHRTLWQLEASGVLKNTKALIFGKWVKDETQMIKKVLKPFAQKMSFPVITGLPCGHIKNNSPLPLWTPSVLTIKGFKAQLQVRSHQF